MFHTIIYSFLTIAVDNAVIYDGKNYYLHILMNCTKPPNALQSSWVVEDDIALASTTCIPAQGCDVGGIEGGAGAAVVAYKDHLGRSIRGTLSINIESTIRASCAEVGMPVYISTFIYYFYLASGQVFNPALLSLDSGEPVAILEGFCQGRAVNNTFAGFVWSLVDQDGVLHHLPHLQGVPDCGEYVECTG